MQKLMKVKASDKFSFPLSINLGPYVSPVDAPLDAGVQVYDLQAILIHKGSSASQGHYGNGLCGIIATSSYYCFPSCSHIFLATE